MPVMEPITEKVCLRCQHRWIPRQPGRPARCPNCKSRLWDRPRKISKRAQARLIGGILPADAALVVPAPSTLVYVLPETMFASCGDPEDLYAALSQLGEGNKVELRGDLAGRVTPHSFIARAAGWSMHNGDLPRSISSGDRLLMTPFDEFNGSLEPGTIVLARIRYKNGEVRCTLKEYTGKSLKANNPRFRGVQFGRNVEEAVVLAVCRGVQEKVFD